MRQVVSVPAWENDVLLEFDVGFLSTGGGNYIANSLSMTVSLTMSVANTREGEILYEGMITDAPDPISAFIELIEEDRNDIETYVIGGNIRYKEWVNNSIKLITDHFKNL